jgi:hypothetical protein
MKASRSGSVITASPLVAPRPADGDATGAHEEAAMAYTMEQRMVCAHKQGRMMSIFARNMTRSAVEQEAKLLFSYVQEREAFMAGYEGERRRRAELVP